MTSKEEIEDQFIKEYLESQDPEIMLDVQNALQAKQEAARTQASAEAVAANKKAIFSDSGDMILGNPKETSPSSSSSTTIAVTASMRCRT